ncbi:hypothetical protein [Gloeocapsa sp. PCC 73106]|uniref:hypothetical protein n=1 Tax=Gloeocapsa sp. PCC 73106 TaxID=102232 RepID=UPI0002AC29C7|nr:hypothetical protein [Gloeocapsa sp. PCC 73106]ELR98237.1 hypothetical protein GLO73106DRAFT_00020640 [Gloeocapsa sp. PCC 73106]
MMKISIEATFEQAIAFTQSLMQQMEANQLSDAQIQEAIASLVEFPNGARGFFVTYLTADCSLPDLPSPGVIEALRSSPMIVADLLVKNLAMSSAMAITHSRQDNTDMADSSRRVTRRTRELIQLVDLDLIAQEIAYLKESVNTKMGKYQNFLERWGYDEEQLEAIAAVATTVY